MPGNRHPPGLATAGLQSSRVLPPMSLKINELCVNCDVCEPVCPNQAIAQGETIYVIDPARCTECVGHFDEPQCVVVCPVECIDPDPAHPESEPQLLAKLRRLQQAG
jgi:ferredoxin